MPSKRILMLEDDYESLIDVKEHLEEKLDVEVELTAEKAIQDRLGRERFDLILLDLMIAPFSEDAEGKEVENVQFPSIHYTTTGVELLRRLRQGTLYKSGDAGTPSDVSVIAFSALASKQVQDELKELGIKAYFGKPFRLEDLVKRVAQVLEE